MFSRKSFSRDAVLAALVLLPSAGWAQGQDIEPNNPCTSAQNVGAVGFPYTIAGSLQTPDIDFFRFSAKPGESLVADHQGATAGVGTLGDPLLGLFDDGCNLLALNDDAIGTDSRLLFSVPANGNFILAATAFPDFEFQGGGEGSYELTVGPVLLGDSVSGRLVNSRDGSPVSGDSPTSAFVQLFRCFNGSCFEFVGFQTADSNGAFRLESGNLSGPLLVGSYQLQANANGFEFLGTDIFDVAQNQAVDLGDIVMTPYSLIGSIAGRLVDALTGAPLSGFGPPYAFVQLERCEKTGCFGVAGAQADEEGRFRIFGVQNFLAPGAYRLVATADDYITETTDQFIVDEFEDADVGDLAVTPVPIQFGQVEFCEIPPAGGLCAYRIELTNRGRGEFRGQAWSVVDYFPNESPFRVTRFQVGRVGAFLPAALPVALPEGASEFLEFQFAVPGNLPDLSNICVTATVGSNPTPRYRNYGERFLFCATVQAGRLEKLSDKQGRKTLRELRRKAAPETGPLR